jgi:hypothetical protein
MLVRSCTSNFRLLHVGSQRLTDRTGLPNTSLIGDKLEPHRSSFAKMPMASSKMSRSALRIVGPLSHARLWMSNGHPASVVIKNQHLTIEKRPLSAAR